MNYPTAMAMVLDGSRLCRDDFRRVDYIALETHGEIEMIVIRMKDGTIGPYSPSNCDRLSSDWRKVDDRKE